ncbi:MAG TPA: 5,6-dimethylbenzimidazole synthase [Steroidobacteraceae bacterium]|nr:5,6-dimethylbenzimidazole synthase [Steroidobacteraceae bacterium]
MSQPQHRYEDRALEAVYRVIHERRDVRHFVPLPVDPAVLQRLLEAAHAAPSVGLSQPWRFVRITRSELRAELYELVQQERLRTADALAGRREEFLRLKVEGIRECGELIVVAVVDGGRREVFGRRTLPEMDLTSTACAIQNLWLAARAEGLGMGWVSIFDPQALAALLNFPPQARAIAVLCIGHVAQFDPAPRLALEHWREPRPLRDFVFENGWRDPA